MYDDKEMTGVLFLGVIIAIVTAVIVWHIEESECQQEHNVADCAWTINPFTPVPPEPPLDPQPAMR